MTKNVRFTYKILIIVALVVNLSIQIGCAAHISPPELSTLEYEIGITTQWDVVEAIGLPNESYYSENGKELITHYYRSVDKGVAIPLFPLPILVEVPTQSADRETADFTLIYNADGLLSEVNWTQEDE